MRGVAWRRQTSTAQRLTMFRKESVTIVQHLQSVIVYEALLTQPDSLERIRAMRRAIEQMGGALQFEPVRGATLVTLSLPRHLSPAHFFPQAPFFPA